MGSAESQKASCEEDHWFMLKDTRLARREDWGWGLDCEEHEKWNVTTKSPPAVLEGRLIPEP